MQRSKPLPHQLVGQVGVEDVLALLSHRLDEVAAVVSASTLYQCGYDMRTDTLTIAHDSGLRLGTQVSYQEHAIIYGTQLLKQFVERCE